MHYAPCFGLPTFAASPDLQVLAVPVHWRSRLAQANHNTLSHNELHTLTLVTY